eukprot:scaffold104992_cov16-Tisochrysis_lutea.AAC.2
MPASAQPTDTGTDQHSAHHASACMLHQQIISNQSLHSVPASQEVSEMRRSPHMSCALPLSCTNGYVSWPFAMVSYKL